MNDDRDETRDVLPILSMESSWEKKDGGSAEPHGKAQGCREEFCR